MTPLQAILTIIFGALAGGITNTLAIWMLFHPYEPPRLGRRRIGLLQGAIPKNKARLASRIGRTVGTQLLTSEDLARTLAEPPFRAAFDERLGEFTRELLDRERGPIVEELPDELTREVEALVVELGDRLAARLDAYLDTDAFRAAAERRVAGLCEELADQEIGELLTPAREQALAEAVDGWFAEAVGGSAFERAVDDYLSETTRRLLAEGRTFEQVIPAGLVAAFESAVASYLPLALERLGRLLEDPAARQHVERMVHELLERFMRDLKFHQRLVAALLITPDTIDRVLRAIEAEGADKLAELLNDPPMRDAMARGVNEAVVDFLRRPAADVLGRPEDESVQSARATVKDWLVRTARNPQTREFLSARLRGALAAAEHRTWSDLFRRLPPDRITELLVRTARSPEARSIYREGVQRAAAGLLHRPIGRPADHLPEDASERLERALAEPLWDWIQVQVPAVVRHVDIAERVELKILDFPTARLEEIVRAVTERELKLIVRLGYLLGAFVGSVLVGLTALI